MFGFVGITAIELVPEKYDWVEDFEGGIAKIRLGGRVGYLDKEGREYWDMTEDEARQQRANR